MTASDPDLRGHPKGGYPLPYWARCALLATALLGSLAALLGQPPMHQDLAYHNLADRRTLLGVPNAMDVLTSLPFLLIGAIGLRHCVRHPEGPAPRSWQVFFTGAALVGLGSAWYHLEPTNQSLVWDRLPMSIAFMGVLVSLLAEYLTPRLERLLLLPAVLVGSGSVVWWAYADDLRLYAWVQLAPVIAIPLVLALFRGTYTDRLRWLGAGACYVAAKTAEQMDGALFHATGGLLSGHSLKHLLAVSGLVCLYAMIRIRQPTRRPTCDHIGDGRGGRSQ
ncbi:MAG: ceramidase domain-containing protein [Proteobacteria bacterium]|nr:ceramidase domain-containing protein [Pseudomonadota bacterium]